MWLFHRGNGLLAKLYTAIRWHYEKIKVRYWVRLWAVRQPRQAMYAAVFGKKGWRRTAKGRSTCAGQYCWQ